MKVLTEILVEDITLSLFSKVDHSSSMILRSGECYDGQVCSWTSSSPQTMTTDVIVWIGNYCPERCHSLQKIMFRTFDEYDWLKFKHDHFQTFFLGGWLQNLHKILRWLPKASQIIFHAWQLAEGTVRLYLTISLYTVDYVQPLFLLLASWQPTFCIDISNEWLWNYHFATHLIFMKLFSNCILKFGFCCCCLISVIILISMVTFLDATFRFSTWCLFNWVCTFFHFCSFLRMLSFLLNMP